MRYDEAENRILISCRELVRSARRGFAAAPNDSEEPIIQEPTDRVIARYIDNPCRELFLYEFENDGYAFRMSAETEKADGCKLWFACEVDSSPKRPKKELVTQKRGEAFITALVYAKKNGLTRVELNYVYYNPETDDHETVSETCELTRLEKFFKKCVSSISVWAKPEIERVTVRLPSMRKLKFPYKFVRDGQSEFVRKAYKTIARGGVLYAQAPTGTGKTVSAVYPAIRAMGEGLRDKTFYFTPKETTANAVIDCLELLAEKGGVIRGLKLTAKEKLCRNGSVCRESRSKCESAKCNGISEVALKLYSLGKTVVTSEEIDELAARAKVCPYELSLTYAELCDFIICDFNYLFDKTVFIRRFFTERGNYAFLIDEAHNLPDRAREMYSAEITEQDLLAPTDSKLLGEHSKVRLLSEAGADAFRDILFPYVKEELRRDSDGREVGATHAKDIPVELYDIFDKLTKTVEDEIFENYSAKDEEKEARLMLLYSYYYKLKKFRSVMHSFDSSYETFIFYESGMLRLKLYCIDTGKEIARRLELGEAAIFFSATLTPLYYYKALLGGDGTSDILEVDSPFESGQLSVSIMDKISTRYSERDKTLPAVCRAIAATVSAKRGNYMIFSPSFAYSEALASAFSAKYPKIKVLSQRKDMTRREKEKFLEEFKVESTSYLIGFCVMGGIYSEGIDLVGDSLIGAVVVGIGMPALSYEREAICAYFDEKYEEGKQFAYIYPGMNRVLQAAGRVIRRETDRGVIVLIDDRFDDPIYKRVIPKLWSGMKFIGDPKQLKDTLDEFWKAAGAN